MPTDETKLRGCQGICAAPAVQAQVLNPNVCPGGTLYSSRDEGAYSGFSTARDVVQADCQSNIAGGAESQAGIDLTSGNTAIGRSATERPPAEPGP